MLYIVVAFITRFIMKKPKLTIKYFPEGKADIVDVDEDRENEIFRCILKKPKPSVKLIHEGTVNIVDALKLPAPLLPRTQKFPVIFYKGKGYTSEKASASADDTSFRSLNVATCGIVSNATDEVIMNKCYNEDNQAVSEDENNDNCVPQFHIEQVVEFDLEFNRKEVGQGKKTAQAFEHALTDPDGTSWVIQGGKRCMFEEPSDVTPSNSKLCSSVNDLVVITQTGSKKERRCNMIDVYDNDGNLAVSDEDSDDYVPDSDEEEIDEIDVESDGKKVCQNTKNVLKKDKKANKKDLFPLADSIVTSQAVQRSSSEKATDVTTPSKNIHKIAVRDLGVVTPTGKREVRNRGFYSRVSLTIHSWALEKGIDLTSTKLQITHFKEIRDHGVNTLNILRPTNTAQKLFAMYNNNADGVEKYQRYVDSEGYHKYPDNCSFFHCRTLPIAVKENTSTLYQDKNICEDASESHNNLKHEYEEVKELLIQEKKRSAALLKGGSSSGVNIQGNSEKSAFICPFCQIQCARCDTLKRHIKDRHTDQNCQDEELKERLRDTKSYCKFCKKEFAQRSLFRHEPACKSKNKLHSIVTTPMKDKRAGYCKICKEVKANLPLHMKSHPSTSTIVNVGANLTDDKVVVNTKRILFNDEDNGDVTKVQIICLLLFLIILLVCFV